MHIPDFESLIARLDPPLWLVTSSAGQRRGGLVATFVIQASIVPNCPRMLVGVAKQHHTWQVIEEANAFALHLLGQDNLPLVWRFGLRSGHEADKWDGLSHVSGPTGSPLLEATLGWLDCRVEARLDTGDRTVYLGQVVAAQELRAGSVLTLQTMLQGATPEQKRALKDLMVRDAAI